MSQSLQRKIIERERLAQELRQVQARGGKVVQCHGCFDIVHPGHVQYLQFARQLGDVLVVSLTGDAAIAKGADRPYIPQELRAENLAALEFVDWVVVDSRPTACELLEMLRPDVYVKGREYAGATDPRFLREKEVVEQHGGCVVFHSGDVVFSSTRLIRTLEREENLDECRLRVLCQRNAIDLPSLTAMLGRFTDMPVVIVGDVIREHYVDCDASAAAPDAPVLSLQKLGSRCYWGGAAAVALQLRTLGAKPFLLTATARDDASAALQDQLGECGVEVCAMPLRKGLLTRQTILADDTKLYKLTDGAFEPLDSVWERRIAAALRERFNVAQLLVWCDYGGGLFTPGLVRDQTRLAHQNGVLVTGHAPEPRSGLAALCETDLLCVTERRLREALHDMGSGLPSVAWNLLRASHGHTALVSLHKRGLIGFDGRSGDATSIVADVRLRHDALERLRSEYVPPLHAHCVDLLGIDEAVLASASLALASGSSLPMAAYIAAAASAIGVARPGLAQVEVTELQDWLNRRPELRAQSRFLPDAATLGDIARVAPPLPDPQPVEQGSAGPRWSSEMPQAVENQ